jgi:methyl-accepting chemotaxis protein
MKTQGSYLGTINTGFLVLLAAHVPVCCAVAMYFDSGFWLAAILGTLSLAAPALMYLSDRESRSTSVALGISAMCFSALLIHLSGGMVEMHFHIFTMLALMIAFRFPWPLVCGAVTIAVHHVLFFIWLPHSLFDHHGSWAMVFLHAFFVVFEVVPALWLTHMLDQSATTGEANQAELKAFAGKVRAVIHDMNNTVQTLAATSAGLHENSGRMTANSHDASNRTHIVAAAAEEMSSNAAVVANGMDLTAGKLSEVASATEDMTSTISEIAGNSARARKVTDEATQRASQVTAQMNQLNEAVREIGTITDTITEISSQTNLLALNASIEAARAGAAGKGFAVVASEIKALAQQTATATVDIKSRIDALRKTTSGGIQEIEKIARVVEEVSGIVSTIAASIDEQAGVTHGIAVSVGEASASVKEANQRVAQTSLVTGEITRDLAGVDRISGEMARSSEKLLSDSNEIGRAADQLKSGMARFQESYDRYDQMFGAKAVA